MSSKTELKDTVRQSDVRVPSAGTSLLCFRGIEPLPLLLSLGLQPLPVPFVIVSKSGIHTFNTIPILLSESRVRPKVLGELSQWHLVRPRFQLSPVHIGFDHPHY